MAPERKFIAEEIGAIVGFETDRNIFDDLDIMAAAVEPLTRGLGKRCHHLFTDHEVAALQIRKSRYQRCYLPKAFSHCRNSSGVIDTPGWAAAASIFSTNSGGTSLPSQNGQPQSSSSTLVAPPFYRIVE